MKDYLNSTKANLALRVINHILDSILLCVSIILPPLMFSISSTYIDLLATTLLVVCSIEVSNLSIWLKL